MKKIIARTILVAVLAVTSGATPCLLDGGGHPPLCDPSNCPPLR